MKSLIRILCTCMAACLSAAALAQAYPAKPVRIIVPYPAGGTVDGIARILQPQLAAALGQPVIVDNKSGGAGRIGTTEAVRSAPDGYTLVMVYDNYPIDPLVYKDMPYDAFKDLVPVSLIARAPLVAIASSALAARDLKELVSHAKANPGKVDYGSTGVGSSSHLMGELFAQATGTKMTHIPYKGGAVAQTDLLGGSLQLFWATTAMASTLAKTGKVRVIGQAGTRRSALFPDVPTIGEQGLASIEAYGWSGLMAPAGTPPEVLEKLRVALKTTTSDPAVVAKLTGLGFDIVASSASEFKVFLEAENAKWGKLIQTAHISLQN